MICKKIDRGTGGTAVNSMKHNPKILHLVEVVPTSCRIEKFNIVFVRDHHLPLAWETSVQHITSRYISLRHVLILFSHLGLGLPNELSDFSINTLHASLFSTICPTGLISDLDYKTVLHDRETNGELQLLKFKKHI